MKSRTLIIAAAAVVSLIAVAVWWRNRPAGRAERMLRNAAETASVTADEGQIMRRMKAGKLRDFTGYELHVDVEGIALSCDLMQEEAIAAWAYVVGEQRYLTVDIMDVELISSDDEKMVVNAEIRVDSNYQQGRYSKSYPVVMELMQVERRLRVASLKTRF